jgi:hypothetical protein
VRGARRDDARLVGENEIVIRGGGRLSRHRDLENNRRKKKFHGRLLARGPFLQRTQVEMRSRFTAETIHTCVHAHTARATQVPVAATAGGEAGVPGPGTGEHHFGFGSVGTALGWIVAGQSREAGWVSVGREPAPSRWDEDAARLPLHREKTPRPSALARAPRPEARGE